MKLAIVGSREYPDMEQVRLLVRSLNPKTIVISGAADGVDTIAIREAQGCLLATWEYPADWPRFGKRAGFLRNQDMVRDCDRLVAFWDGKSKGTKNSILLAKAAGKLLRVFSPGERADLSWWY